MITFYNDRHSLHHGKLEMFRDTFADDPIAGFGLVSPDYLRVGEDLAACGLPAVFVFEGGYALPQMGVNAVNVLEGFLQRRG
jgi:acetoin utilization deacetylase AcuC-like enzyme